VRLRHQSRQQRPGQSAFLTSIAGPHSGRGIKAFSSKGSPIGARRRRISSARIALVPRVRRLFFLRSPLDKPAIGRLRSARRRVRGRSIGFTRCFRPEDRRSRQRADPFRRPAADGASVGRALMSRVLASCFGDDIIEDSRADRRPDLYAACHTIRSEGTSVVLVEQTIVPAMKGRRSHLSGRARCSLIAIARPAARTDSQRYFGSCMTGLARCADPGVLLGVLSALVRDGFVADVRCDAAREPCHGET